MVSAFCKKVYAATRKIPQGRVATYGDIARAIGHRRAWRAVGRALHFNRDPKTPCHRVVRSDGQVGGFGFPGQTKEKILRLRKEGIQMRGQNINLRAYRLRGL